MLPRTRILILSETTEDVTSYKNAILLTGISCKYFSDSSYLYFSAIVHTSSPVLFG